MGVLISADMEGATGVTWRVDVEPGTEQWQRCRRIFTSDVNAAIDGFTPRARMRCWSTRLIRRCAATGLPDTGLEGPVCESTDSFGRHVLPPLDRGDLVAIEQTGAYGASFTSRYNGRPPSAEIPLWLDGSL